MNFGKSIAFGGWGKLNRIVFNRMVGWLVLIEVKDITKKYKEGKHKLEILRGFPLQLTVENSSPSWGLQVRVKRNLDSKAGKKIMGLFKELHQEGVTLILVTHDITIARQTERLIHIKDGEIVADRKVVIPNVGH